LSWSSVRLLLRPWPNPRLNINLSCGPGGTDFAHGPVGQSTIGPSRLDHQAEQHVSPLTRQSTTDEPLSIVENDRDLVNGALLWQSVGQLMETGTNGGRNRSQLCLRDSRHQETLIARQDRQRDRFVGSQFPQNGLQDLLAVGC
jgi:hypothetical protein